MAIHERYLGRTLRCTSCRTEFVAAIPESAPPLETEAAESEPRRSMIRRATPWMAVALVIIAALWWLGQEHSKGLAGSLFGEVRAVGEIGALRTGDSESVIVAFDRESIGDIQEAVAAGDRETLEELLNSGHCLQVTAGTRVRVLEKHHGEREMRVRIIDGPWASRIVWVPGEWVR